MNIRRIVSLAALVGLALVAAACSGSNDVTNTTNMGRVQMALTAAAPTTAAATLSDHEPSMDWKSANATLTSILARNTSGELVPVMMDLPTVVDLLALRADNPVELPVGLLPPGDYDQFVVVMKALEIVTRNDTKITIEPPGGGWTAVVRATPFSVVEGQTTSVTLKFRKWSSFSWINDKIEFHPDFDCEVDR